METTSRATTTDGLTTSRPSKRCLVDGCACKDVRILSTRRAAFHAAVARERGQTSDRVIAVDREWRLPSAA